MSTQAVARTVLVFYRVCAAGHVHHFQASFLRSPHQGARPGEDLVRQMEHVGYVCVIEPGSRVRTIHEVRAPCETHEAVEQEVLRYLADKYGTAVAQVEEIGRHVFEAN